MSHYMHKAGKRGRPTRFDDQDLAVLTAVITILDARKHKRGRHPDDKLLAIVDDGSVVTITDTVTELTYTITDSAKVKDAHKTVGKPKEQKAAHTNILHKHQEAAVTNILHVTKVRGVLPAVNVTAMRDRIAKLKLEAENKKLDL